MKYLFTTLLLLLTAATYAQTPQIARVSSDGITTVIYTDIKKALSESQNDDFIYLPAGTFNVDSIIIQKRVNVVGTGIYPDSTKATGKTVINGNVFLTTGRDGGSLQGIEFSSSSQGSIYISGSGNFTISKCMFYNIQDLILPYCTGIINIKECVLNGSMQTIYSNAGSFSYNVTNSIINNKLTSSNGVLVINYNYSLFTNCTFLNFSTLGGNYNEYRNSIFRVYRSGDPTNSRFYNSHIENFTNSGSSPFNGATLELNSTFDLISSSTFTGGACPATFSYTFDFHVKSSSSAAGSGTDGTDKGIYGTMYPYNPNPYNPHIYSKSISPTTNAQGQLQINVKVKAQ